MSAVGRPPRRSRRIGIVILAIVLAGGLTACKALPKPKVPTLGGDVTSPIAVVR